jgi:hypothetical protein
MSVSFRDVVKSLHERVNTGLLEVEQMKETVNCFLLEFCLTLQALPKDKSPPKFICFGEKFVCWNQ